MLDHARNSPGWRPDPAFVQRIRALYQGDTQRSRAFRYGLIACDLLVFAFIIAAAFAEPSIVLSGLSLAIGLLFLADLSARIAIGWRRPGEFPVLSTLAEIVAIASFLGGFAGRGAGSLRAVRTLRLVRTAQVTRDLRRDATAFRRNEEVILAVLDLCVFVFVMTGLVYASQRLNNPTIGSYLDALYFTVGSLTTTGFNDVNLLGASGRVISLIITVMGLVLLLRVARVYLRPTKLSISCPVCSLQGHDLDALHCKECGSSLDPQSAEEDALTG